MKRTGFKKKTYDEALKASVLKSKSRNDISIKKSKNVRPRASQVAKTRVIVSIRSLKKKLWSVFSKYIRERDKYTCICCGKVAKGGAMHAGHFITGATCSPLLYFDDTNVHAQCYHCNINLSGNWVVYEKKMVDRYGLDYVNNLKLRRTREMGTKVYEDWYYTKIEKYKKKINNL